MKRWLVTYSADNGTLETIAETAEHARANGREQEPRLKIESVFELGEGFICRTGPRCGVIVHDEGDFCGLCAAEHADADRGDMVRKSEIEEELVS
jgi:hypothetical protein